MVATCTGFEEFFAALVLFTIHLVFKNGQNNVLAFSGGSGMLKYYITKSSERLCKQFYCNNFQNLHKYLNHTATMLKKFNTVINLC